MLPIYKIIHHCKLYVSESYPPGPPATPNFFSFLLGRHSWHLQQPTAWIAAGVIIVSMTIIVAIRFKLSRSPASSQSSGKLSNPIRNVNLMIGLVTVVYIILVQVIGWMSDFFAWPQGLVFPRLGLGISNAFVLAAFFIFNAPAIDFAKRKFTSFCTNLDFPYFNLKNNRVEEIELKPIRRNPSLSSPPIPATAGPVNSTDCHLPGSVSHTSLWLSGWLLGCWGIKFRQTLHTVELPDKSQTKSLHKCQSKTAHYGLEYIFNTYFNTT